MAVKKSRIIWNIPRLLTKSWHLFRNPEISKEKKLLILAVGLGYFLFPLDLLPDVFPLLGQIDDLGLIFLILNWFVNSSQKDKDIVDAEYYISDKRKKNSK